MKPELGFLLRYRLEQEMLSSSKDIAVNIQLAAERHGLKRAFSSSSYRWQLC